MNVLVLKQICQCSNFVKKVSISSRTKSSYYSWPGSASGFFVLSWLLSLPVSFLNSAISVLPLVLKCCSCLFKLYKVHFWCTSCQIYFLSLLNQFNFYSFLLSSSILIWIRVIIVYLNSDKKNLYELVRQSGVCIEAWIWIICYRITFPITGGRGKKRKEDENEEKSEEAKTLIVEPHIIPNRGPYPYNQPKR